MKTYREALWEMEVVDTVKDAEHLSQLCDHEAMSSFLEGNFGAHIHDHHPMVEADSHCLIRLGSEENISKNKLQT